MEMILEGHFICDECGFEINLRKDEMYRRDDGKLFVICDCCGFEIEVPEND